jgi:formylmethanofuran dehydrogenase subunit E
MDHPQVRHIERTGYSIPVRNPQIFQVDPITCDCGARAVLRIKGNNRCSECGEDEGVCLL